MSEINIGKANMNAEGRIYVSEDVILRIISGAIRETKGAHPFGGTGSARRFSLFGRGKDRISFKLSGGVMTVSAAILVSPGFGALETAQNVQRNIKSAVQSLLGTPVISVNVAVSGVLRQQ